MNSNEKKNNITYRLANAAVVGIILTEYVANPEKLNPFEVAPLLCIHLLEATIPKNFLSQEFQAFLEAVNLYSAYMSAVDCVYDTDNTLPVSNFGFFSNAVMAVTETVNSISLIKKMMAP